VKDTRVSIIEASHHKAGSAYVAAIRYQMDDRAPYIWKTDDYGRTWKKIVTGIRASDYVHVVREDPARTGLLYAGTEHGFYVSFNDGDSWEPLSLNLPDVQVSDIAVTEKDIVVGTHGRSIYVLDDVAPLREFQPAIADSLSYLYTPFYAVRNVQDAVFQYYLRDTTTDLKLEILDVQGQLVQSFTGRAHQSTADSLAEVQEAEEYGYDRRQQPPSIKKDLNTFTWDLRYPPPAFFKGIVLWSASPFHGPLAPPGKYQVRLTAGGQVLTRPFEIKLDPRLKAVTPEDVQQQFQLAMMIRNATNKANQAVIEIRRLKDRINRAGPVNAAHKDLLARLSRVEEDLYQVKNQSGQDPLNFPIKLNNRLATLEEIVETGDARPTAGDYQVFQELSADLNRELAELNAMLQNKKVKNYLINGPSQ
jgi:hypothetical protein